jgi:hypothetical protein
MLKFISGIALGVILFGIVAHTSKGQSATAQMKTKEVRQGDNLFIDVSVDRAPNFYGTVTLYVGQADSAESSIHLNCSLGKDKSTCQAGTTLAPDTKLGKWTVKKITFKSGLETSEEALKMNDEVSFHVVAHGEVINPRSATINIE